MSNQVRTVGMLDQYVTDNERFISILLESRPKSLLGFQLIGSKLHFVFSDVGECISVVARSVSDGYDPTFDAAVYQLKRERIRASKERAFSQLNPDDEEVA